MNPITQEMEIWNKNKLLQWIQQKEPELLKDENLEKFKAAHISGKAFLKYAGDVQFFKKACNLPIGTSERLADLASEIAGGETAGVVQKGNEQDTSTGKSTDHTPLLFSLH